MSIVITNWDAYRAALFQRIDKIVNSNGNRYKCIRYTILGRNFLDTRLILHFDDCNQVFDFSYNEGEQKIDETKFFTKDFTHEERMEQLTRFDNYASEDKPE